MISFEQYKMDSLQKNGDQLKLPGLCRRHSSLVNATNRNNGTVHSEIIWRNKRVGRMFWKAKAARSIVQEAVKWCRLWYMRYWIFHFSKQLDSNPVLILGDASIFLEALETLDRISVTSMPVLLVGETGTGKELFARALHMLSGRRKSSFVTYNCGQLTDDNMALSTLFGHRKGSYTGALYSREGLFRAADGGTLLLDELEALTPRVQSMLLRALELGEIYPVGIDIPDKVDVRVIAATNQKPQQLIATDELRKDLFFRLRGSQITMPPLRDRGPEEVKLLARAFLKLNGDDSRKFSNLKLETKQILQEYSWPGNIRELHQFVQNIVTFEKSTSSISVEDIHPLLLPDEDSDNGGFRQKIDDVPNRLYRKMVEDGKSFWDVVKKPFLARDLNREQVQHIIARGLEKTGSYKKLLELFGMQKHQYQKFMDFLRTHRLKTQK